jgi:hypothetical protein
VKILFRLIAAALIAATGVAVVLAQAPALDVKMGLWEMTTSSVVGGQTPAIDTSKMTPEQRARVETAMQGMMGAHTNVAKSCMTREKFDRSSFMATDEPGSACKQTITTNTRSTLEGTMSCTGEHPTTGQIHIDALSSTNVKATIKMSETNQGKTMNVNLTMTGKWLSADCGTVKP